MCGMVVKRVGMAEREAMMAVIEDAFAGAPWYDNWQDRGQVSRYISDLVGQPNSLALGLFIDDQLMAVALGRVIHWYAWTQYRIDDLGVRTVMQGKGFGSRLLKAVEQYAAGHGIDCIVLRTNRQAAAYRFYLRNGYQRHDDEVCLKKQVNGQG